MFFFPGLLSRRTPPPRPRVLSHCWGLLSRLEDTPWCPRTALLCPSVRRRTRGWFSSSKWEVVVSHGNTVSNTAVSMGAQCPLTVVIISFPLRKYPEVDLRVVEQICVQLGRSGRTVLRPGWAPAFPPAAHEGSPSPRPPTPVLLCVVGFGPLDRWEGVCHRGFGLHLPTLGDKEHLASGPLGHLLWGSACSLAPPTFNPMVFLWSCPGSPRVRR